jgi:hypothetical protein
MAQLDSQGSTRGAGGPRQTISNGVTIVASASAVVVVVPAILWFRRLVSSYGLDGAIRYIWEGSPYPPRTRERMEDLDDVQDAVDDIARSLLPSLERGLEIELQTDASALPNTESPETSLPTPLRQWEAPFQLENGSDLRNALAIVSDRLDKLAAQVDAVPSGSDGNVKVRKKALSNRIVVLMGRADRLLELLEVSSAEASNPLPYELPAWEQK